MLSDAQVLGISSPPPVAGSSLITPEMTISYCVIFFALLIILYIVFYFIKRPLLLAHKLKLVLLISLVLKVALIFTISMFGAFWLLPTPKVEKSQPSTEKKTTYNPTIQIAFNRPLNRASLKKEIIPDTPGIWTFEDPIYATHLYRKLVFHPSVTLRPDTKYTIKISNISNFLRLSPPTSYSYSFTTLASPKIKSVTPTNGASGVEISMPIKVVFTQGEVMGSIFEFTLTPNALIEKVLAQDKRSYSIIPKKPLDQGVTYTLIAQKTDVTYHIPTNIIVERGDTTKEYEGTFTTKEAPGIVSFTPTGSEVFTTESIRIIFTQPMDRVSVENNFFTEPKLNGSFTWSNDSSATFKPTNLAYETIYKMKVPQNTKDKNGGYMTNDITKSFTTIGRVRPDTIFPQNGANAIGARNQVKVTFDQAVVKESAQSKFTINPPVAGEFSWNRNTLIFTPTNPYAYSTLYTVDIASGIDSVNGLASKEKFTNQFTTQDQTTKLKVPSYLQKYSLSCELASLRMVLEFKGVKLSEDKILEEIGVDSTPRNGNIWGNPHNAFVGNVNGRQMVTGYGVYWEPISRVARNYRGAADFRGWSIEQLTKEIGRGNPVIIWTFSSNGSPTGWNTPFGLLINAVRGEHTVVVVGYVGQADNPTAIIVNDPLLGQIHWPRLFFEHKWGAFGQSGVVVY